MRFQPAFLEVEGRIAAGDIGEVGLVQASLGFAATDDPSGRLFTPGLGGGSLLDLGVYPLTLAISLLGPPTEARAVGEFHRSGVDAQVAVGMRHDRGLSSWSCSLVTDTGMEATIGGTEGNLHLAAPFHHAARLTYRRGGEVVEDVTVAEAGLLYRLEVREVHRCLAEGSDREPAHAARAHLLVMRWLDELRDQLGPRGNVPTDPP